MQQISVGRVRVVQWLLLAVLATAPVFAYALGMGKLVVRSGLDEPLQGEIELLSVDPQELKTLKTSLAPRGDFDNAGIERPFFLNGIKYDVIQRNDGRNFLLLSTHETVREPFLHFLLQVEWSGGKLIREYTALLDPPQWADAKPAEIQPPELSASLAPESEPESEFVPAPINSLPAAELEAATEAVTPPAEPEPPMATASVADTSPAEKPQAPMEPAPPAAASTTKSQPTPPPSSMTEPLPETLAEAPAKKSSPREPADDRDTRAWASTWEYGPVKKGETLGRIAETLRVDKTLTSEQIMIALLRANPSAFYAKNVNNLKAGTILSVPERDEVESISKGSARTEFQAQYEVWQKYKAQIAAASSRVTVPSEPRPAVAATTEPKQKQVHVPAQPAAKSAAPAATAKAAAVPKKESAAVPSSVAGDEDLLKIVRSNLEKTTAPDTAKAPGVETRRDAAKEQRALTEKVATLQEEIESKELQNKELRERVGKMQEQVKNTSRLIDLENKDLAQAQKQAAESAKAAAESAKAKAKPVEPPQPVAAVPVVPQEKAPTAAPAPKPAPAPAAAAKPVPKPAPKPPVVTPPAEETDFFQSLLSNLTENPVLLAVLGVLGVLAAGITAIHYVRRRRAAVEFEESILSGGSIGPDNSSISESTSQPGASDTSFLSDFSQGGMGNIHTDEVDPIAEAEVYLAYGRDEQAEDILKEAVVKDPARHELKQKLLEIYHQRNDVSGFETLAEELYAALEGKGGKVWDKVEEMGRKISPSNPMFRGGAPSRAAVAAPAADLRPMETHDSLDVDTTEHMPAPSSSSLDFDMGEMLHEPPPASADSGNATLRGGGLDFDLGDTGAREETGQEAGLNLEFDTGLSSSSSDDGNKGGLDMDFNLQDETPAPSSNSGGIDFAVSAEPIADNDISLDFDAPDEQDTHQDEGLTFAMDATAADNPTLDFESSHEAEDTDVAVEEPQWDETATKLDLAKAYIDMGDAEGARSILDEVLEEGNESQRAQARELATHIH